MEKEYKVAAGIVIRQNRVLLVQRSLKEGLLNWQFPAGKLEMGEDVMNAVEREVFEETGIVCKAIHQIGSRRHPVTDVVIHYIACHYLRGQETIKNTKEVKEIRWVNPVDLTAYIPEFIYPKIPQYFEIEA